MARKKEIKELDFEQALVALEDIVKKLEEEQLSLDSSIELFQKGIDLTSFCSGKLTEAQQKVQKVNTQKDGDVTLSLFDIEGD